jgi:hypothetical protein
MSVKKFNTQATFNQQNFRPRGFQYPVGLSADIANSASSTLSPSPNVPITVSGTDVIFTFTDSATIVPNFVDANVEILAVAGGGATGTGGGGAGGLLYSFGNTLTKDTTYTITVGAGGSGGPNGTKGANTTVTGGDISITAVGGGIGGGVPGPDKVGGSGGGAGWRQTFSSGTGTPGQGNAGGNAPNSFPGGAGGGGGAGATGGAANSGGNGRGGVGGVGLAYSISGSSVFYAGGGGGGHDYTSPVSEVIPNASGGNGGGGNGTGGNDTGTNNPGTAGAANRGGGGGGYGSNFGTGYNGGSGVVILRVKNGTNALTGYVIN